MFSKTNIEIALQRVKKEQLSKNEILKDVKDVLRQNEIERKNIKRELQQVTISQKNAFNFDLLKTAQIFHKFVRLESILNGIPKIITVGQRL